MKILFHIIYFKLRALQKITLELSATNIVKTAATIIVFGGFALGAYFATRTATNYLLDTAKIGSFLFHRFLSMLLFVYFLSINVGNIIVSYATFYRSPEMIYYLTKPISHTQLFIIKFFDNFFYSSTAFFLIAFTVLLGYGSHFHMPWVFYLNAMFLMLLPFMLIAGCIAVILLLVIVRYAMKIGVRKIIALLVLFYLGSVSIYFTITSPLKVVARVLQHYPHLDQYFGSLDPPITKYLPNYWIAESFYWTTRGEDEYAVSYTVLMILTAVIVFCIMLYVGKKLFYQSWLASLNFVTKRKPNVLLTKYFSFDKPSIINPQTGVLLKKEFWQFIREPSQWIHLGIISILVLTFLVSIANINLKQNMPFLQTVSYMVVLLFNAFLISSIALRFVFPSISIEGMSCWSIASAPIRRSKIFWLKYLIWFTLITVLSVLLVIFSHHSLLEYPLLINSAIVIMISISFAFVSLNMGAGSYFADLKERNPIRVASSQSATVTFLLSIIYLTVMVAILFMPLNSFFSYILKSIPFNTSNLLYAVSAFVILSLSIGFISIIVGSKAMNRDF
jgi:ABC-2 type transport system permease protein